ncbi:DUF5085 family protein [Pseudogracilibacillus auburnensis]|uniref:Uncharacterized protein DUF5085 n=1 Tax=Pseudogracilibacillus auburnensis TaxID=1494959 RepID=A0A2V3VW30_9BACI|nr:DUF5085 family protein [Pseudogracilibacillus auburnensis]MBO1002417.1 DUF5085 family protein [Pseudogracilibacillus auburnensis]PXW86193.1 uncharacterized protein DUF5085 [Pseudogracilibacillus auburnensis]
MVIEEETMMYRNVVWHSYELHYQDFDKALADFNEKLVAANLSINGPLFYSLHNVPLDEMVDITIYIPVEQSYVSRETNLFFQTYFYIDQMLMTRVKGNFEVSTELSYEKLFTYALENNLQISSPMYHILNGDDEVQWVDLKIKVFSEDDGELTEKEFQQLNRYMSKLIE